MSSVVGGYDHYRAAAKDAIKALDHLPCLMEISHPASARPPQSECLQKIESSDVVILLLGSRYGEPQASGLSPTEEEFHHACSLGKPILVFVESVDDRESLQSNFLARIGGWEDGYFFGEFSNETELTTEIVGALRRLEQSLVTSAPASIERLPPICRERIALVRESSVTVADQLIGLLSDPASRQPGALGRLVNQPQSWLSDGGYAAWEAISEFLDAHNIGGSVLTREKAIAAGSPRSDVHLIRNAVALAEKGDQERAAELLSRVESDHPLLEIAHARIANDPHAVVQRVVSAALLQSEDSDLVAFVVSALVWGYWQLERFDLATTVLREANDRFPGRAWLLFFQAHTTLGMVDQIGLNSAGSHGLLKEAAELAVRSRDYFRDWHGPSHLAVEVGMRARLFLGDPQSAVDLAMSSPNGGTTESEATEPAVQANLARAYLMLGEFEEINNLQLSQIGESESALIRAMQAHALGDPAARLKLRKALALADDEPSRCRALLGLASFGEIDKAAMSRVSAANAGLFQGVAAFHRGDLADAVTILFQYRFASFNHAHYLALAQYKTGNIDDAIETLTDAAEQLGIISLLEFAAEILVEHGRLDEAESMATAALARVPSGPGVNRLRSLLVVIADRRQDWGAMESFARAIVQEAPQDVGAAWRVVYALHRQSENRQAWAYLVAHDLLPFDEDTARLAVAISSDVGAPDGDASRLLKIVDMYSDSEQVSGFALGALMSGGDSFILSDEQRSQFRELLEDFLARYPESDVLRAVSSDNPEALVEQLAAGQQALVEQTKPLVDQVRYGRVPYGVLRIINDLPYAELLRSLPAVDLTAIPADPERRNRERQAAKNALGTRVAVDTSVAALGVHADLDVKSMGAAFKSAFVADELIVDARVAVASASLPVAAILGFDPGLGQPIISEIDEEQRTAAINGAERVLDILYSWQHVKSGHLGPPAFVEDTEDISFRPWDASLRVALARKCSLWCDDLALRVMAESEGIVAFGTWALYEVLLSLGEDSSLPPPEEMKMRLLRARIADVPISLEELERAADDSDGPDIAIKCFLHRPFAWNHDLSKTLKWYLRRVEALIDGPHRMGVPGLLYAASYGLGSAADPSVRQRVVGALFASTLLNVRDPETVPVLLTAARYAVRELDPGGELDPLQDAVRVLLESLEVQSGAAPAAQVVRWMFSKVEPDDHQIVMSIMFGIR